jgi:uncharacterized protein YicC (UPF0701 family)
MAQQNNPPLGEISTIRDILMGEQIHEYDSRFKKLEEEFNNYKAAMTARVQQMQETHEQQLNQLQELFQERLNTLEQSLNERSAGLEEKINAQTASDRNRLGALLQELGQQLSNS